MRYPLGIQAFMDLRDGDYVYVDKTAAVYSLACGNGKYYFLSRPRRFGKSLLELYFQNTMSLMLKMMGFYVKTEHYT